MILSEPNEPPLDPPLGSNGKGEGGTEKWISFYFFLLDFVFGFTLLQALLDFITPVIKLAKYALVSTPNKEQREEMYAEFTAEERPTLHAQRFMNPSTLRLNDCSAGEAPPSSLQRMTSIGPVNWLTEFERMGLPIFWQQYLQVLHVPLDVMHECLKLQLELGKQQTFSPHILKRVSECGSVLAGCNGVEDNMVSFKRAKLMTPSLSPLLENCLSPPPL